MAQTSYLLAEEPEIDLAIAKAMAHELEAYLAQEELYWTLIVHTPNGDQNLKMTVGDLLTRLRRLQHGRGQLSDWQNAQLDATQQVVDQVAHDLRTLFQQRLQREVKARLNSLRWFLDDCPADPQRCRVEFPFEMRNRQRIEEIVQALGTEFSADLSRQLVAIDQLIHSFARPGEFIWDKTLEAVFPQQPYWYLYVRP